MKKIVVPSTVALAALCVLTTVLTSGCASQAAPSELAAGQAKPTASVSQVAPLDLASQALTFTQKGATVSASNKGTVVASLTLKSATYGAKSGHAVFTVDAKQPVLLDRGLFVLYDADGGENTAASPSKVTLAAGQHSVVLDFRDTHARPQAIGWVPVAGAGGAGTWQR